MNKEFIFTVEINGMNELWKCVVGDTEVITYDGDMERERLPIGNTEKSAGVYQIDTKVSVYGDMVPFRLESGIPHMMLDGEWIPSDTTTRERLQNEVKKAKQQVYLVFLIGIIAAIIGLVKFHYTGSSGTVIPMTAVVCISMSLLQMISIKREADALGLHFTWRL